MVDVLVVKSLTRPKSYDRRGRVFVGGHFIDFETELETFLALAVKYLQGNIKEVLLPDAEHPLFTLETPDYEDASRFDGWPKNTALLPARKLHC